MNLHCFFVRAKTLALSLSACSLLCFSNEGRAQSFMLEDLDIIVSNLNSRRSENLSIHHGRWFATAFTTTTSPEVEMALEEGVHWVDSIVLPIQFTPSNDPSFFQRHIEIREGTTSSGITRFDPSNDALGVFNLSRRTVEATNSGLMRIRAGNADNPYGLIQLQPNQTYYLLFRESNSAVTGFNSFTVSTASTSSAEGNWDIDSNVWLSNRQFRGHSSDSRGRWINIDDSAYLRFAITTVIPEPSTTFAVAFALCVLAMVLRKRRRVSANR